MQNPQEIVAQLARIYDEAVATLRADITAFVATGTPPPAERQTTQAWCYPELRLNYAGKDTRPDLARAFGRLSHAGAYACTITRPALFADYLTEQLALLMDDYAIRVEVARSPRAIPFPYVIDAGGKLGAVPPLELARHF